ncbi:LIM and calponin homology domains-containing protein 1 isoform X7 [Bombina bombina]|uniref:LIM and calponin homology domains-containing protein 1 isoform X7 n=1 Tax=Bombina bombina TaxID=8345 RepID=UPI00235AA3E1|nr:LIM and calponin homology domains-containing protein 1 isoform X7 [Bombina bombina]
MASPALDLQDIAQPQESPPDSACKEAQKWIEQVTGRSFGDKDFRTGLENGILLCELLNAIKPGLVKKINRLPTPIAGLDNLTLFLRGCKELGLKESQLFDPGDLQDTSNRTTLRTSDCSRKLRNVLVTVYWLGKVANSCSSYDGKNLDLKEFEGLLAQMRKENEEIESPKRSIRDSGYIDCWDSERSDSLSPPRHGRDDSFDSLDSFGSRSQQTPSPDVVLRGSSDGRGSDSESDVPHRRIPDVRKDDMSARRVSFGENKAFVPFNQYLPNKGNHTAYIPAPLRKKKAEREDYRKSWSTATSPLGGERPFSQHHPETIKEEHDLHCGEDGINQDTPCDLYRLNVKSRVQMMQAECVEKVSSPVSDIPKSIEEDKKLKNLEQAGIRVRSASKRYGRSRLLLSAAASNNLSGKTSVSTVEMDSLTKTKAFAVEQNGSEGDLTEKETSAPNPEKDDMMCRRISISQKPVGIGLSPFLPIPFSVQQKEVDKPNTSSLKENKLSAVPSRSVVSNNPPHALESVRCDSPTKPLYQSETEEHVDLRDDQTYLEIHDSVQTNSEGNTNCTHLKTQLEETLEISDHELRFSSRSAMSDDTESVSMCDMRYEGEAILLPHSRLHQEHLQNVNDMLKEEDDTWQDDLARWKTRRRSASQDLLKKEEERKKMERLLSGDYDLSERRKSIKTYKEIVEEKERREKQLHEAYKNAKSKAEAEKILQKYIERFTISEAVLERLVMPKILERSHSVEPSLLSSSEDPNPLKYLRQQSLPSSKYTATVEATIASNMDTFVKATPDRTSPNKGLSKAVPMLTPKPYSQPKNTQQILKTFKVDGKISMNGEACNGIEEQKESMRFSQPLSRSQRFEGVARVDAAIEEMKFNSATCVDLNSSRPSLQNSFSDLKSFSKEANHTAQREEINCTGKTERFHSEQELKKVNKQPHDATKGGATVTSLEFTPSAPTKDPAVNGKEFEERQKVDAQALIMHWTLEQKEGALPQFSGVPEDAQKLPQRNQLVEAACSEDLPAPATSVNSSSRFCSWDPEEERKRQERWQQEQERLLQERYQKEQEKLKEEWEKAQKEVEEEERKYYEEERKIIEDTVMPLTVSPTSCVLLYDSERIGNSHSVTKEHEQSAQEDNRGTEQSALWAQEGAHCVSEEQLKGKLNVSTVEVDSVMRVKESEPANVSSMKEYSTPNRLTLQLAGQQVASAEAPLPGDIGNTVQRNISPVATRGTDSQENICGSGYSSQPSSSQCPSPNRYKRSVSGKKLCSTCGLPLGKGAAMIIETLSLYFHIQCFKCGICKGQLGDATTGTDVRIRNGLLNCNDCYMKSRTAGHPTPL